MDAVAFVEESTIGTPIRYDHATSLCVVISDHVVAVLEQRQALQREAASTEATRQRLLTSAAQMGGRDDGSRPTQPAGTSRAALSASLDQLRSLEQQFDELRVQPVGGRS